MKAEDIKSAVTFLSGLPQVDPQRIAGVGVCGGGGYLPLAAASDPRIRVLASIVPHTGQRGQVASGMGGLYGNGKKLLARARAAREAFARGEPATHLTFMPNIPPVVRTLASVFSPRLSDMLQAIDYYERRDRGFHPNRKKDFLIWSAEAMAAYDLTEALAALDSRPLLVVTSERAYYTHSLVGAAALAFLALVLGARLWGRQAGIVIGLLVFSHWVLDLVAHSPDLPVQPGNYLELPLLGFGLWLHPTWSALLELAIVAGGVFLYADYALQKVTEQSAEGHYRRVRALLGICTIAVLLLAVLLADLAAQQAAAMLAIATLMVVGGSTDHLLLRSSKKLNTSA